MVVGCYTLDVYCENDAECHTNSKNGDFKPATFTGDSLDECLRAARKAGWVFSHGNTEVWCSRKCKGKFSKL